MKQSKDVKKICGLTTLPITINAFMLSGLNYMADHGYKSYVVSQPGEPLDSVNLGKVKFIPVQIKHGNVSPIEVIKTIRILYKLFRKEKFDVIQYATSNAALYASIAGWFAHVPVRVYCQWGISYIDYNGIPYWFYRMVEKVTCMFSTSVQPDSPSNLKFSIREGLYKPSKGCVILNGSATGVDLKKYDFNKKQEWKAEVMKKYSIPNNAFIFGFVGRLVPEKGINELLEAFLSIEDKNAYLMLVGPIEEERLNQNLLQKAKQNERVIFVGNVLNAAIYHASFTYLMLPSYREGFGMTTVEAAALGTPAIVSRINGPTDFVKDGFNGFICEVKSTASLLEKMRKALLLPIEEYHRISDNAYALVKTRFDSAVFKEELLKNRNNLLAKSKK